MSKWTDKDFWASKAKEAVSGKVADWPNTRFPTNGRLNGASSKVIRSLCQGGKDPWLILVTPVSDVEGGVLAAWDDRLAIVKAGLVAGASAGALGGERVGTFHFTDITGIEYHSSFGMVQNVLEILTASHSAERNKTSMWGDMFRDSSPSARMTNTLKMDREVYKAALRDIDELRRKIGEAKKTSVTVNVRAPEPATAAPPDAMDQLRKLADLHAAGILTDEEFAAKKAELLGRM